MADDGGSELPDDKKSYRRKTIRENYLQTDPFISGIGLFCLKMVLILNGGAVIALMGIYPDLRAIEGIDSELVEAGKFFLKGLIMAGGAAMLSYVYQSYVSILRPEMLLEIYNKFDDRQGLHENETPHSSLTKFKFMLMRMAMTQLMHLGIFIILIACAGCYYSFVQFTLGGYAILNALDLLATSVTTGS